ncbi:K(lysine) acetyltransferase [Homalodisca vitripennis]|nr:K(lysine) acetyltransferase [Homalodisca vitripennis]
MSSRFDMTDQQWKSGDRAMIDLLDQSDRKITRNQKRRHDEINHIQKLTSENDRPIYQTLIELFGGKLKSRPLLRPELVIVPLGTATA